MRVRSRKHRPCDFTADSGRVLSISALTIRQISRPRWTRSVSTFGGLDAVVANVGSGVGAVLGIRLQDWESTSEGEPDGQYGFGECGSRHTRRPRRRESDFHFFYRRP
jgi:hypothetical protein